MEIEKIIEDAWLKTVEDFKNAERSGEAWLWTEATLRLDFLRHLCEIAKLDRILAETPYHLGEREYKPDIVADVIINTDTIFRVAFEMKFFGQTENWKEDLEKLSKYRMIGWDYGYFLALGTTQQCDEIQKETVEETPQYKIKVLTHPTKFPTVVPDFKFAELVLKKSLREKVSYVVNELWGAMALYEKYGLAFDMSAKENKLVIYAIFYDKPPEEQKIKELGYTYITFDEEGKMHPSVAFTGQILIGEFECTKETTDREIINNIKEPLNRFKEKIAPSDKDQHSVSL